MNTASNELEFSQKSPNGIVVIIDNTPVVSHRLIADKTNNDPASISRLIRENTEDFEEFGRVGFQIQALQTNGGKQNVKEYYLNEQQATLLMTYLRNNQVVKEFKKNLVRAFYELKSQRDIRSNYIDIAKIDINDRHAIFDVLTGIQHLTANIYTAYEREKAQSELATKTANNVIEVMHKSAHKLNAYDQMIDAKGWLSFESAASLFGMSGLALFKKMREYGLLKSDNIPKIELIRKGYFKTSLVTYRKGCGDLPHVKPLISPAGLDYLRELFHEKPLLSA